MSFSLRMSVLKNKVFSEAAAMEAVSRLSVERRHIQHGNTSVFEHSMNVAFLSLIIGKFISRLFVVYLNSIVRGSMLHDYFLYDWHEKEKWHRLHGFRHAKTALHNARKDFLLNIIEEDIIKSHMFPLNIKPPKYLEGWIITITDKICSLFETFKIRLFNWEKIL